MDVVVVRHAEAGDRWQWSGHDRDRPLTAVGHAQAEQLAERLATLPLQQVLTSHYRRCVETVEPLAGRAQLNIDIADALTEGSHAGGLLELLDDPSPATVVACTHGDVIASLLQALDARGVDLGASPRMHKAGVWHLRTINGRLEATYEPPPRHPAPHDPPNDRLEDPAP